MIDRSRLYHGAGAPLEPAIAVGGYALAVASFFAVGLFLGGAPWAQTLAQIVALAGVPLLLVRLHGGTRADLGLCRPPLLAVIGALIAGSGSWLIALMLARPVVHATHSEHAIDRLSRELLAGDVAQVLLYRALIPAVCEELLHRGLVLGSLAPRYGRVIAIAATTLVFGLLHLEPARMVGAAVVGLLAGTLATWSRSVVPAMVVHATNNAVALGLALGVAPSVSRTIGGHPEGARLVAVGLVVGGITLGWIGRQRS
jgi:membrane protease YdiL (CAAX protease family)